MMSDFIHVPFADHMLVAVLEKVDLLRLAGASDNLQTHGEQFRRN